VTRVVYPDPRCDEDEERIVGKCKPKCDGDEERIDGKCVDPIICPWYYGCPPYEPEPVECEEGFVDRGNGCESEYPICPEVAGDNDCMEYLMSQ
jgi:hypothetical protein